MTVHVSFLSGLQSTLIIISIVIIETDRIGGVDFDERNFRVKFLQIDRYTGKRVRCV